MTSVSEGEKSEKGHHYHQTSNTLHFIRRTDHINSAATPTTEEEEEEVLVSVFR